MLDFSNRTPFSANFVLLPDATGVDTLYVNVKASFKLDKSWTLLNKQEAPSVEDIYWGAPGKSSLKLASDAHIGKPCTDIAIIGSAWSLNKTAVRQLEVSARVGKVTKTVLVFGQRSWRNGHISEPATFATLPLRYEHAFGGQYWRDDTLISLEARNPVGKGYLGEHDPNELEGVSLPEIEDPSNRIRQPADTPQPAGFGFIPPNWHPRSLYAGTFDTLWQRDRAPFLPKDYQTKFQNSASPGLVYDGYMEGGEAINLRNMHPGGEVDYSLPIVKVNGSLKFLRQAREQLIFFLETVILNVDEKTLSMVWKASCRCNNDFPRLRQIDIHLLR